VHIAPVPDPAALQRQAGRQPPPPPPPTTPPRPADAPWWQLLLRGYPVKTPGQNALLLPTRALALAVAGEWEWLDRGRPLSVAMPLTALCATASDQPKPRAAVEQGLLKFVHTDAAAVRHEPGTTLARKQAAAFDGLLAWAADPSGPIRCPGGPLVPSPDVAGAPQSPAAEAAFARYLRSLDAWTLAAVDQATAASKSLVVGCALAEGRLSVREAARCARLEEDHQAEEWGEVEAAHDLDACDARARVGAAAALLRLLRMD
jgi:ATP synthase F1 complex assembly factor 2